MKSNLCWSIFGHLFSHFYRVYKYNKIVVLVFANSPRVDTSVEWFAYWSFNSIASMESVCWIYMDLVVGKGSCVSKLSSSFLPEFILLLLSSLSGCSHNISPTDRWACEWHWKFAKKFPGQSSCIMVLHTDIKLALLKWCRIISEGNSE